MQLVPKHDLIDNSNSGRNCIGNKGLHLNQLGTRHVADNFKQTLNHLSYFNRIGESMVYPWCTFCTFVTPLSSVVLTLYLTWCLFRIIDISHIPHLVTRLPWQPQCYVNNSFVSSPIGVIFGMKLS